MRKSSLPYLGLTWTLLAGACASTVPTASSTVTTDPAATAALNNPESVTAGRFSQPGAQSNLVHGYWITYNDFQQFAEAVDVVFVGTITGTRSDVLKQRSDEEDPDPNPTLTVYDGIDFAISEVLSGSVPGEGSRLTMALPVLVSDAEAGDINQLVPIVASDQIALLREGIDNASNRQRPSYLVFATLARVPTGNEPALFFPHGPGSVAPLGEDNKTVLETNFAPFDSVAFYRDMGTDITIEAIRDWIENGPPRIDIPEKFWPKPED